MKLLRFGPKGQEKPGLVDADGIVRDLSAVVDDIAGDVLSDAGLARRLAQRNGPAEPRDRLVDDAEHLRRRALDHHRPDIGIGFDLSLDLGLVRVPERIGVGGTLSGERPEFERLFRRGLDLGQRRQKGRLGEIEAGHHQAETGDEDGAVGDGRRLVARGAGSCG